MLAQPYIYTVLECVVLVLWENKLPVFHQLVNVV